MISINIDMSLRGKLPYNHELEVGAYEPAKISLPKEAISLDENNRATSNVDLAIEFPQGVIIDKTGHRARFFRAPAQISAGTFIGTLAA